MESMEQKTCVCKGRRTLSCLLDLLTAAQSVDEYKSIREEIESRYAEAETKVVFLAKAHDTLIDAVFATVAKTGRKRSKLVAAYRYLLRKRGI